ncbi:MAG: hypothetical protein WCY32_09620 [Burkholderiaceae bacterium]
MTNQEMYDHGVDRLVEWVKSVHESHGRRNWTETRRRYEAFAQRAEEFANLIAEHEATDIEEVFERHETEVGADGWPIDHEPATTMKVLKYQIQDLAASARTAASELPTARQKLALPMAAKGFLYLRYDYGFDRPALSNNSEDVRELGRICQLSGIVLSPETVRNALAEAIRTFDPHYRAEVSFLYR